MINKKIPEFSAQAYHAGEFKSVSTDDVLGNWAVFCFYPADFSFVCPTELGDLADTNTIIDTIVLQTMHHHPKEYELVRKDICEIARRHHTSFFVKA